MERLLSFLNRPARAVAPVRGFTLIEMIVVLSIIVIITAIALLGQSSFNRSIVLTNTAYTLAFSIRDAQSRGLSSRLFGGVQDAGYGVHLTKTSSTSYVMFADIHPSTPNSKGGLCPNHTITTGPEAKPGDCSFSSATEIVRTYTFEHGFSIANFCGLDQGGTKRCSGYLDAINISFARPDTQSVILGVRGASTIGLTSAAITLSSPDGTAQRCVNVSKVGQVFVANGTCP